MIADIVLFALLCIQEPVGVTFLADWGYLKESDRYNLSNEIKLLKLGNLEELVAI